jgi:hypothetical protein
LLNVSLQATNFKANDFRAVSCMMRGCEAAQELWDEQGFRTSKSLEWDEQGVILPVLMLVRF